MESKIPVINFTPNEVEIPAVLEAAKTQQVPLAGRDGKTGQTYFKIVLASAFRARNLPVNGWYSLNILGNRDGANLMDPEHAACKLSNKSDVLENVLGYQPGREAFGRSTHKVRIDYYPPRGDAKEAWDVIDFEGIFGLPMSLRMNLQGRDSILAAPMVLDLARWMCVLRLAKTLDCGCISIPPGGPLDGGSRVRAMSLFHKGLEEVVPVAESMGVKLLVEPEPDLLIERTSEFKEFIREVRSPQVGINFDIGHFFCAGEQPQAAFEELYPWVGHVHLEDIGRSRIHQHLVPGDGAIDFREVFQAMKRLDYRRDISLELYPYVNLPETAGRLSLEHIRPLLAEVGLDRERC